MFASGPTPAVAYQLSLKLVSLRLLLVGLPLLTVGTRADAAQRGVGERLELLV